MLQSPSENEASANLVEYFCKYLLETLLHSVIVPLIMDSEGKNKVFDAKDNYGK
jgi:hypothetical protein